MNETPPQEDWKSEYPAINDLLEKMVIEVRTFAESQVSHIHEMVKIGLALSAEKNLDNLLEMIVSEARRFTNADGGTLYIQNPKKKVLDFAIVQNQTLSVRMGGTGEEITWPSVPLKKVDGSDNRENVSAYCAIQGEPINIPDVYNAVGFDFQGTKKFDSTTGYRSKSMLLIPLRDHEDEVIGVLQLLNAVDRNSGKVIGFPDHEVEIITSLASQAAIALTNMRLIFGLEELLNSFVQSIAGAIDEKSPYTAGHVLRVAELTTDFAKVLNDDTKYFPDISYNEEELTELSMAAWMHDVGKITTPEHIIDKATKLETIYDRIDAIRYRFEVAKKDLEIQWLRNRLGADNTCLKTSEELKEEMAVFDEHLKFIDKINFGSEFLPEKSIERLDEIAQITYQMNGKTYPLLTANELENLKIRKGTLTNAERDIITHHVSVSIKMLENLPFPRKLKNVPLYAGMHHEKLDGSGYPRGLNQKEIPRQGRILAVADIFEALTAADRPYKPGKLLSESIRIMGFMVKDKHLDKDICNLLIESGLAIKYAKENLAKRQLDDFTWNGVTYSINGQNE
jgi:HD-GYP domain-containing protein (c-di-GMP phosphodiesterase class II)